MTFVIAAAGTGGHVFPGLAVGEALVDQGVSPDEVLYVGGDRLEAKVYPERGFPFLSLELQGLQRSLTTANLRIPSVVRRARWAIEGSMREHRSRVALGMGGYVTIPLGLAARRSGIPLMVAEQNAIAGLANRVAHRWAKRSFTAFPQTRGLREAEWVGNPVRRSLSDFDRSALRGTSLQRYELEGDRPILGVFGGSLGAGVINEAVSKMARNWDSGQIEVLHLTGPQHLDDMLERPSSPEFGWHRLPFEDEMAYFYAACDLAIARAGGGVAELTATATPAVLVPGSFGSTGHQDANAAFLSSSGAAVVVEEPRISGLGEVVADLLFDEVKLAEMANKARSIARPEAARVIAAAMVQAT